MNSQKEDITSVAEMCEHWARIAPKRIAFTMLDSTGSPVDSLTYGALFERAEVLAEYLRSQLPARSVAILMHAPGLEFIAAFVACIAAGVLPAPVHPAKRNRSNQRIIKMIQAADAAAVLSDHDGLNELQGAPDFPTWPPRLLPIATDLIKSRSAEAFQLHVPKTAESAAFLQFTSGSTSLPKGVVVTHAGLLENLRMIQAVARTSSDTTFVSWLPHYHDLGLVAHMLQSLFCGGHCVLLNPSWVVSRPIRWLQAISHYGAHYSGAPDFAFRRCLATVTPHERDALDLSSLRFLINAAECIKADTLVRFQEYFSRAGLHDTALVPAYGLAEATVFVSANGPDRKPVIKHILRETYLRESKVVEAAETDADAIRIVGCGTSYRDEEIRIVDPGSGKSVADGYVGEIWVAGTHLMAGYYNNDVATREAFGQLGDSKKRFLRTGDLGFLADGELFISGRLKDMLVIRGVNYYPQDIEQAASAAHPGLRGDSIVAFDVEGQDGNEVVLVVELERATIHRLQRVPESANEIMHAIIDAVRNLADHPMSAIALVHPGQVPITTSGKLRRQECKKKYLANDLKVVAAWSGQSVKQVKQGDEQMNNVDRILRAVAGMGPEHLQVFSHLTRILEEKCGLALTNLDVDHSLFFFGVDSLQIVSIQAGLEQVLGRSIPTDVFFSAPTIPHLVDELVKSLHSAANVSPEEQIAPDVERLSEEMLAIHSESKRLGHRLRGRDIMLTGATGYLGIYLLKDLLGAFNGTVYCTARAANAGLAKERIVRNASRYDIHFDQGEIERIVAVVADISRERLGLNQADYDCLASDIGAIYHCAAIDNFFLPYCVLRPTNALGTVEMIRLALHGGVIPLYHVSSCAASLLEEAGCQEGGLVNGYAKTKYVGEQIMRRLIKAGFPGISYRFGYLYSLEADMADTDDAFETFITAIFELGRLPDINIVFDLIPVEYAAKSIVFTAALPIDQRKSDYTLYNPVPLSWMHVSRYMAEIREEMQVVSLAEFERLFHDYVARSNKKNVKLLRSVVSPQLDRQINRMFHDVDVDLLPLTKRWCPPCDESFARHYVDMVLGNVLPIRSDVQPELSRTGISGH